MNLRQTLLALSMTALSITPLSCRAGGTDLKEALERLSENDLAIMVLPKEELGDAYAELVVSSDSGFQDNEEAADDTFDPDDTAEDFDELGRITGYELSYESPELESFEGVDGILSVSTVVDLHEDAGNATSGFQRQIDDFEEAEGVEEEGFRLDDLERFDPETIGDEVTGLRFKATVFEREFYGVGVFFRRDRLTGTAGIIMDGDRDLSDEAERLAQALNERVDNVLRGDVEETPVPVPTAEDEGEEAETTPPEGIPDLPAMALAPQDVGPDASIAGDGYVEDDDTVATFERSFDSGSSAFVSLDNSVELYESAGEASFILDTFETLLQSQSGEALRSLLAQGFEQEAEFEASNIQLSPLVTAGIGEQSTGYQAAFDTPLGRVGMAFVAVRVENVIGTLILVGPADDLNVELALSLARALAGRIAATPGSGQ